MALYKYKKIENYSSSPNELVLEGDEGRPTAWKTVGKSYDALQEAANSSKLANVIIPGFFVFIGLFFIYQFFYPKIQEIFFQAGEVVAQGTISVASDDFIDRSIFISNPAGLTEISKDEISTDLVSLDDLTKNFTETFYITIPSIGIESLPITPNVNSFDSNIYNQVLKNSLAHFQDTALPISTVSSNIVLYGHSASPSYNPQRNDPEVAFSFLPELKVGDLIYIDIKGERYTYKMYQSDTVQPDDLSIIYGLKDRQTLTLFTCFPPGNSKERLVILARPV